MSRSPHGFRVLLVDDSRDEREMYAEWLQRSGIRTLQASRACDAYRLAAELLPEVLVTELALPGEEDGLSLTRRVKENSATRDIRVLVLTANAFEPNRLAAERAGCDLFLAKPCLPEALMKTIDAVLRGEPSPLASHAAQSGPDHQPPEGTSFP